MKRILQMSLCHVVVGFASFCFADPDHVALMPSGESKADANDSAAVAVMDIALPGDNRGEWDWASRGLADLLQIELQARGVETLDRELPTMISSIAAELIKGIPQKDGSEPAAAPVSFSVNPESLIMFYSGIDACANGRPQEGVIWFLHAYGLDPDFTLAWLWEAKAYRIMGFEQHANAHLVRHNKWSSSTAILLCEGHAESDDSMAVVLKIYDLLSRRIAAESTISGSVALIKRGLPSMTRSLLEDWVLQQNSGNATVSADQNVSGKPLDLSLSSMGVEYEALNAYLSFCKALIAVQLDPESSGAHRSLANGFAGCGKPRHAALEVERTLECLDARADDAATLYIKGTSQVKLNRFEDARISLYNVRDMVKKMKNGGFIPIGPGLTLVNGVSVIGGSGGKGGILRVLIQEEIKILQRQVGLTEDNHYEVSYATALRNPSDSSKWIRLLEDVSAFWQSHGVAPEWIDSDNNDLKRMEHRTRFYWQAYRQSPAHREHLDDWEKQYLAPGVHESKIALEHLHAANGDSMLEDVISPLIHAYLRGRTLGETLSDSGCSTLAADIHIWTLTTLYDAAQLQPLLEKHFEECLAAMYPLDLRLKMLKCMQLGVDSREGRLLAIADEPMCGKANIPGKYWAALAREHASSGNRGKALALYRQALKSHDPTGAKDGLDQFLIRISLDESTDDGLERMNAYCRELDIYPWIPGWKSWFDEGCRLKSERQWAKALVCFRHVKSFLESPHEIDVRYKVGNNKNYAAVPVLLDDKNAMVDARWSEETRHIPLANFSFIDNAYVDLLVALDAEMASSQYDLGH